MNLWILILVCLAAATALALGGYRVGRPTGGKGFGAVAWLAVLAGFIALGGGAWLWFGHGGKAGGASASSASPSSDAPASDGGSSGGGDVVVPVQTQPARQSEIARRVRVYGATAAEPGAAVVVSVPYEAQVSRVLATPGQRVADNTPLVEVGPSPDTRLQLTEARNALETARENLKRVQQQYQQQLATNANLSQAKQAQRSAQAKLGSLQSRGAAGKAQRLTASQAGVVASIGVKPGQVVAPGTMLIEVVPRGRIEARLGVNPLYLPTLKPGQRVELVDVFAATGRTTTGRIRLITQRVDPKTRLVDVYVSLPKRDGQATGGTDGLLLNTFVQARLTLATHTALVVPTAAVLPVADGKQVLYTEDHGKAVAHQVATGITMDQRIELIDSGGVKAGDMVVVSGNAELSDGMAVTAAAAGTSGATSGGGGTSEVSSNDTSGGGGTSGKASRGGGRL